MLDDSQMVKGNRQPTSTNTAFNSFSAAMENMLGERLNTAEVVKVTGVQPGGTGGAAGYVTVQPLVKQTSAKGETLPNCQFFRVPYFRIQAGNAAIVIDPVPGDIGIVVFTKSDSSGVGQGQSEAVPPGSFRKFDQGDGFYVASLLNKAPETWVEFTQGHAITINGPQAVTIKARQCTIDAQETHVTGNLTVDGKVQTKSGINNSGDVKSGGISLESHTHRGVETGPGSTGGPQ